jgi:SAM-dependent methyltransferase
LPALFLIDRPDRGRKTKVPVDDFEYFMESDEETFRLDVKTDPVAVEEQALWAQIGPGMRVADLGCGSGKTTSILHGLTQPGGAAVGVDISEGRIEFGRSRYGTEGIDFVRGDIRLPLDELGSFDLVWVRFVLEYYRSNAFDIVRNVSQILKPGGTLCLIDLDLNCLNYFGMPERLERTIFRCARLLEQKFNFDAYAGRKLYAHLYDLGYDDIAVKVGAHHVIYGMLNSADAFNWMKKMEVVTGKFGFAFDEYEDGKSGVAEEFSRFFSNPRRFSYTPLVCASGRKTI